MDILNESLPGDAEVLEDLLFSAVRFCDITSYQCEMCKCDTYSGVRLYLNSHKEFPDDELNFFNLRVIKGYRGFAVLCDECWDEYERPLKKLMEKIVGDIRPEDEVYSKGDNREGISKPVHL
ncbi:hypothetical protein CUJ83_11250 [Methanocella sp. CWC-04]|uniref:Uncharacterized protein n=1 Tax=Methanooceanicella nereidis TaxID=2052831 RepID=A0AAP2W5J5_9EURY|nr:hypothetical protein [Methanocella sp. CWC-04]MCD1295575.1 hypothetical protein [Methanocella sp. CWC-04]